MWILTECASVADITLTPSGPLDTLDRAIGANRIRARSDLALFSLAIARGQMAACTAALHKAFGLAMPGPTQSTVSEPWRCVSMTADQLLLIHTTAPRAAAQAEAEVLAAARGIGYVTLQTDAWVCIEVSGPDTRAALARICPIDLDPAAFAPGATARTAMAHLGVLILRLEADRFWLLSASSSAGSFADGVCVSFENVV